MPCPYYRTEVNFPALPRGAFIYRNLNCTALLFRRSWNRMYLRITSAVVLSPTVLAKYPSSQNSPPHSSFFTWGYSSLIILELTDLKILTTSDIEFFGGKLKNMCTWSLSTSISWIQYPWCWPISRKSSFTLLRISPCNTHFRYFGAHTKWYWVSYTQWLPLRTIPPSYHTRAAFIPALPRGVFGCPFHKCLNFDMCVMLRPKGEGFTDPKWRL